MRSKNVSTHYRLKCEPQKERNIDADNAQLPTEARERGQIKRAVEIVAEARNLGVELGEMWGELDDE